MRRSRALLLAVALLATAPAPARAADPTLLVATAADGSLVKVTVAGRVAVAQPLVPAAKGTYHVAAQAAGGTVTYSSWNVDTKRADVSTVQVASGARRQHTRGGRTGQLLVSGDGKVRCVLRIDADGAFVSLARLDATGRARTLYAPDPRIYGGVFLSGASVTTNGRTVYLARTTRGRPSPIYAVDTATGRLRQVPTDGSMLWVVNVVLSPDAKTLAVSYVDTTYALHVRLIPVAGGRGRQLTLPYGARLMATAFSPDGTSVVLTASSTRVGPAGTPGLWLADVESGRATPILGSHDLQNAVAVA
ncbi:MAG TPA: hypothetical protein VNA20_03440 [Frankiaceae bacterium]|nr:hypothetical protein [Frankiaceae bacterium]